MLLLSFSSVSSFCIKFWVCLAVFDFSIFCIVVIHNDKPFLFVSNDSFSFSTQDKSSAAGIFRSWSVFSVGIFDLEALAIAAFHSEMFFRLISGVEPLRFAVSFTESSSFFTFLRRCRNCWAEFFSFISIGWTVVLMPFLRTSGFVNFLLVFSNDLIKKQFSHSLKQVTLGTYPWNCLCKTCICLFPEFLKSLIFSLDLSLFLFLSKTP